MIDGRSNDTPETECSALIKRLESATGPDRALDHAIFAEDRGWSMPLHGASLQEFEEMTRDHGRTNYTASLDAALTLVPEHSTIRMANCHEGIVGGHAWIATLRHETMSFPEIFGEFCSTPDNRKSMAIALCIAALRARAEHEVAERKVSGKRAS